MTHKVQPDFSSIKLIKGEGAPSTQTQIYLGFLKLIKEQKLLPGDPIPSTRALSNLLKVSRTTVVRVYKRLEDEWIIETKIGSGAFISHNPILKLAPLPITSSNAPRTKSRLSNLPPCAAIAGRASALFNQNSIPFAVIAPDKESLPGTEWTKIVGRLSKSPWMHNGYCDGGGYKPYKKAISTYIRSSRGIVCEPEQVIAVNGIQQGLNLCTQVLFNVQDQIVVEDPYFQPHIQLLEFRGLIPVPIPVSKNGLEMTKLQAEKKVRGALLTPCHQYPLGYIKSPKFQREILAWAEKQSAWILEDDYDSELSYGIPPHPALMAIDKVGCTIYLGSFTKTIYPGFNLGYMVVPQELIPIFQGAKFLNDRHTSEVHQTIMTEFIDGGFYASHVRRLKKLYESRRQFLLEELNKLTPYGSVDDRNEGTHVIFFLKTKIDDVAMATYLKDSLLVETRPLSTCYRSAPAQKGLILGYAHFNEKQIAEGVNKLKKAFELMTRLN